MTELSEHPLVPFLRGTSRGPWLDYMGHLVTVLAKGDATGGSFSIMEAIVQKGLEPPRHVHEHDDEAYYVLEGEFAFEVGGEEFYAVPGDLIFLPRGVPHSWTVDRSGARTLWMASPGGIDELFEEIGEETPRYVLPPRPENPPIARMAELLESKFLIHLAPR